MDEAHALIRAHNGPGIVEFTFNPCAALADGTWRNKVSIVGPLNIRGVKSGGAFVGGGIILGNANAGTKSCQPHLVNANLVWV